MIFMLVWPGLQPVVYIPNITTTKISITFSNKIAYMLCWATPQNHGQVSILDSTMNGKNFNTFQQSSKVKRESFNNFAIFFNSERAVIHGKQKGPQPWNARIVMIFQSCFLSFFESSEKNSIKKIITCNKWKLAPTFTAYFTPFAWDPSWVACCFFLEIFSICTFKWWLLLFQRGEKKH